MTRTHNPQTGNCRNRKTPYNNLKKKKKRNTEHA